MRVVSQGCYPFSRLASADILLGGLQENHAAFDLALIGLPLPVFLSGDRGEFLLSIPKCVAGIGQNPSCTAATGRASKESL